MKLSERVKNTLNFKPVDRLPFVEWAPFWKDNTVLRWKEQGFPKDIDNDEGIKKYFSLDMLNISWFSNYKADFNANKKERWRNTLISDMKSYKEIKNYLFPDVPFDKAEIERWAKEDEKGDTAIWFVLAGFFWFPRMLFGIENHLFSFYDHPDVMHEINNDSANYYVKVIDMFCNACKPVFMTFAEDMAYNHGPMISEEMFDEFMLPYYKRVIPKLKEHDIVPFIDCDGNITDLVPWFLRAGIEGILPLEKQAGVDIVGLRKIYPKLKFIGAFDKMVMKKGEKAMKEEFERILPVMKQGGYIPGVDHQTPPEVSMENYRIYLKLLKEYCIKAVK